MCQKMKKKNWQKKFKLRNSSETSELVENNNIVEVRKSENRKSDNQNYRKSENQKA